MPLFLNRRGSRALILGLLFAVGCSTPAPKGYVAKQWAEAFRELQLTPIFPPREDVQVGDIYLVPVEPGKDEQKVFATRGHLPRGLWVHSLDLNQTISDFYNRRASFPASGVDVYEDLIEKITTTRDDGERSRLIEQMVRLRKYVVAEHPQPQGTQDLWASPGGGDARRLRIVAAPDFMSATLTRGDLSAFFPSIGASFGGSANATFAKAKSVSVKVPVAESYGLPLSKLLPVLMLERIDEEGVSPFDGLGSILKGDPILEQRRLPDSGETKTVQVVRLRISTEVYYARVLEVTIEASKESAAALRSQLRQKRRDDAKFASTEEQTPAPETRVAEGGTAAELRAAQLEQRLNELESTQGKYAGASVRVTSVSENRLGIERTFDRPVAIGFRGFDFSVWLDPETGTFVGLELLGVTESSLPRGNLLPGE